MSRLGNNKKRQPGTRVVVCEGSGLDSNKTGTVVPRNAVKTDHRCIPTNIPGAYRPVDRRKETAVRLDDGRLITMFLNRLEVIPCPNSM